MTTLRPSVWLILLLPVSGLAGRAGALPDARSPAATRDGARELQRAFKALTQPAKTGGALAPAMPDCHARKHWTKTELLALAPKLPAPERFTLLRHFSDDKFLAAAGISLTSSALCDCPPVPTDLGITKTASLSPMTAGQPLSYTLQVTNFGPGTANAVTLSDALAATLSFNSSTPGSPTCTLGGSTFSCSWGSIAPYTSRVVTLDVTVSPAAPGGTLANTATVSTSTSDTYAPNNSQTALVTVTPLLPGRVPDTLLLQKNGSDASLLDLNWTASCGNAVAGYALYEGTLGSFYSHTPFNALCSQGGLSVTGQATGAGSRYYLVVPQSAIAEGSYGVDSNSAEIPPSASPCIAQQSFGGTCP